MRYCCLSSNVTGTGQWHNIRICVFVNLLSIVKKCALLNKHHCDHRCSNAFSEWTYINFCHVSYSVTYLYTAVTELCLAVNW